MTVYRRNPLLMTVMGANPGPRTRKTAEKALDAAISGAWHRLMSGVQVPIMDIPRIFRDIKLEMAGGVPLEQAVTSVGTRYRVNRNPGGPAFIVADSLTGRVMYTKRATGVGSEAIGSCATVAKRLADRNGRSYIVFLDMGRARVGGEISIPWARAMGITDEFHPTARRNPVGEAILAGVTGALVNRAFQSNPHLEDQQCATCGGSLAFLGTLGNREHYRCRNCGMDCSAPVVRTLRPRRYRKLCAHGIITNRCKDCRGRKLPSHRKPCIHGYADATRCLQCMRHQRPGGPVRNNPAIRTEWDRLTGRRRLAVLEFAGIPYEQARRLAGRTWGELPPHVQVEVAKGWRDSSSSSKGTTTIRRVMQPAMNPGPRGKKRRMTMTVEKFANWVKSKKNPAMWKAFLAKFKGYESWTHGSRARKVTVEWVDTPGVDGLWITYDGGKQPESTYIMPKGSKRKGAWKHPWDTMPDIKHDPQAGIVLTKLRGKSRITDFYHK